MNLIKRVYYKWRASHLRKMAQEDALAVLFNDAKKYSHVLHEIDCLIFGHRWKTDFDPKKELSKPLNKRVYCKRCGIYYHKHEYHG